MSPRAIAQHFPPPNLPEDPGFRCWPPRRRIRSSGFRLRRDSGPVCAKWGNRPETPFLSWKFDETNGQDGSVEGEEVEKSAGGDGRRVRPPVVSARKLAAGLWHFRSPEFGAGVGRNLGHQSGRATKDPLSYTPRSISGSIHGLVEELQPPSQLLNSAMEGATKWNPDGWKASDEIKRIFSQPKPFDSRASTARVISALEAELEQARSRINELEAARRSSKRKLEQFLQKLNEERAAWQRKEHEKIREIIDDLKSDLNREKKNRQRLEMVNYKLVTELSEAKSVVKHYRREYEREKKARETVEEICDELAKEIGGDEAKLEAVKRESMEVREEMEEEKRMLQMAEVWREERVQMKLVDAKAMLEEKYSHMNQIIEELDSFLKSVGVSNPDMITRAESIRRAAASINMKDVRQLRYEPSNDAENNEREVEPPGAYSELEEDTSEWETASRPEDQGSSYSPDGSDPSVEYYRSRKQWDGNKTGGEEKLITDISEVSSAKMRQLTRFLSASNGKNGKPPNTRLFNWSAHDVGNPRMTEETKGGVEWPLNLQKNSLKARLLEAKMGSQKIQLRQVLKQEI